MIRLPDSAAGPRTASWRVSPRLLWFVGAALALVLSGVARAETFHVDGETFAIYNLAGRIEVVAGSGTDLVVEVTRGGRDAAKLRIETGPIGGRGTLRVIYPNDRIRYPEAQGSVNYIRVRRDGTFGGKDFGLGSRRVTVSRSGAGLEAWVDLRIQVPRGRATEVRLASGKIAATGVDADLALDTHSGPVSAADIRGSLNVDTGSGAVEVRGVAGDLSIDTGSGSVIAGEVHGRAISIDTGSGAVQGNGLSADRIQVDTGSGSVNLGKVSAPEVLVDTGSGEVLLELEEDVDHLVVDTGSGGVTLRLPRDLGAEISVETGSGGITSELEMSEIVQRRGELHGRIGDGRGQITIETGSGGVRLLD